MRSEVVGTRPGAHSPAGFYPSWSQSRHRGLTAVIVVSLHRLPVRPPLLPWVFLGALAPGATYRLRCIWQSHARSNCRRKEQGQGLWPKKVEQDLAVLPQRYAHVLPTVESPLSQRDPFPHWFGRHLIYVAETHILEFITRDAI